MSQGARSRKVLNGPIAPTLVSSAALSPVRTPKENSPAALAALMPEGRILECDSLLRTNAEPLQSREIGQGIGLAALDLIDGDLDLEPVGDAQNVEDMGCVQEAERWSRGQA